MQSFNLYLETTHPEFHQELLNEINLKYWVDRAKEEAKNLFGLETVKKIGRMGWQEIAKKLAQGAVLSASMLHGVGQAQEMPLRPYEKPTTPMAQKIETPKIEVSAPYLSNVEIQGNPFVKVTFNVDVPKHLLSSEKGAIRWIKGEILKKFQSDDLLEYNPYSVARVSINGQSISASSNYDLVKKSLNPHDSRLDNFKLQEKNYIVFYIPKQTSKKTEQ